MEAYEIDGHKGVKSPTMKVAESTSTPTLILSATAAKDPKDVTESLEQSEAQRTTATPSESLKENIPLTSKPSDPTQTNDLRVLLVEDNEINLKLLIATMRKLKIAHATATNGLEALNAYKDSRGAFDVIFMDISMPIMSGIDSTKHIRRFEREERLEPTRLIALTGAANPNTRQEAFSSGVDLFLTKPVSMKELRSMLEEIRKEATRILEDTKEG